MESPIERALDWVIGALVVGVVVFLFWTTLVKVAEALMGLR